MYHCCYRSQLFRWFTDRHLRPGKRMLLMPIPGDIVVLKGCPCCGSSSSSSSSSSSAAANTTTCGCPPVAAIVVFTIVSGTLFDGGLSSKTLTYDATTDSWHALSNGFFTQSFVLVCRASSCVLQIHVTDAFCDSTGSSLTPISGMTITTSGTGGCNKYVIKVTW